MRRLRGPLALLLFVLCAVAACTKPSPPQEQMPTAQADELMRQAAAKRRQQAEVVRADMVLIGLGVYCPSAIAQETVKDWATVGSLPNTKGRAAINNLKGLPEAVKKEAIRRLTSDDQVTSGYTYRIQRICSMAYGDNHVWNNIRPTWTDRMRLAVVRTVIRHEGFDYHVVVPPRAIRPDAPVEERGCDNDFYYATKATGS